LQDVFILRKAEGQSGSSSSPVTGHPFLSL
jgi:hypothetical protein